MTDDPIPAGDYVSPGFETTFPDAGFPEMVALDVDEMPPSEIWGHERTPHHNIYVDGRFPKVGFVNRDEAHILYNTALRFRGQQAVEIGCWFGWSAVHLLRGGVSLDVIDPTLGINKTLRDSVESSIETSCPEAQVELIVGNSPVDFDRLARQQGKRWSLFFVDGNHRAPYPLLDTFVATRHAEPDALILLHDLWIPDCAEALDYLRDSGWRTLVYNTWNIMGVAWRGDVEPVHHVPDPHADWGLPAYLDGYDVSG